MKKRMNKIIVTLLMITSVCTLLSNASTVAAKGIMDTAPSIIPDNANGKKILFDNTHGQTAGAADWVIDGGFSDYAQNLVSEGYFVQELRSNEPIKYENLVGYDAFIIPEANIPFKVQEQDAMERYVNEGGSIFFIADHYNADRNKNRWDASEVFNGYRRGAYENPTHGMNDNERNSKAMQDVESRDWLAETFGVRFRYNAIGNVDATKIVSPTESFGITEGIDCVAMHAGSTIEILNPEVAKGIVYLPDGLKSSDKWNAAVDQGIYEGGGIDEGAYVAIAKKGAGKAAFLGDSSAVEDATPKYRNEETGKTKKTYNGYKEQDDAALLLQLTNWLTEQEDYTNFVETGIVLDQVTTIFDFEIPKNSTEPQKEPWSNSSNNYKWYDSSTFAKGSYGYDEQETETPLEDMACNIYLPDKIYAGQELSVTICLTGMKPNSTVEHLKVGAYLNGGEQIAEFKEIMSNWTGNYGYSNEFSITTDKDGNAVKTLVFQIKEGVEGSFNIRVKRGSSNLATQTCLIAEVIDDVPEIGK